MAVQNRDNVMLAESPQEFIESTEELFQDGELCRKIGLNGRQMVEKNYSWQKGVEILEGVLGGLLL